MPNNRHNIGFMAADAIARRHAFSPWSKKFQGLIAEGTIGGEKVVLLKPQTFMNLSGQAVGEALRFYKLAPADLTVFYDELDLAAGQGAGQDRRRRWRPQRPALDRRPYRQGLSPRAPRHRPSRRKEMVMHHVLGDFAKADREWLEPLLDAIADNAELLVKGDDSRLHEQARRCAVQRQTTATPTKRRSRSAQGSRAISGRRASSAPAAKLPEGGPMAAMLKKLFGKD